MPKRRSLTLYRRHTGPCKVHRLKLTPSQKRSYMNCDCPIWMVGSTSTSKVPRQSCGTNEFATAQTMLETIANQSKDEVAHGISIADATQKFMTSRKHELDAHTLNGYDVLFRNLKKYSALHGVQFMRQLKADFLEDFKLEGMGNIKDSTKHTATGKLKCFLTMAHRREWIKSPLAVQITSHHAVTEQKSPYSDKEIDAILREAAQPTKWSKITRSSYATKPATFSLLIRLMLETGMRVSDAIRFDPSLIEKGDSGFWIYRYLQTKLRKKQAARYIEAFLSSDLKRAIDNCDWFSESKPFWRDGSHGASLGMQVWIQMQLIGKRAGVEDCRPHRLRDTFAVRSLLRGLRLEDVSRLLGHSSIRTTEQYYAKWVRSRERQLEERFAQTMQVMQVKTHASDPSVSQFVSLSAAV